MSEHQMIEASPADWARLRELAQLCRDVTTAWHQYAQKTGWKHTDKSYHLWEVGELKHQPSPTSYAWTGRDLIPAPGSSFAYLSVAHSHIGALALLLDNGAVMFSLGPLVRSIAEHCGRVAWALDPRIRLRDRLARSFWITHDDLKQARRLANAADDPKHYKDVADRMRKLRRVTLPAKFYPSELVYDDKNHDLISVRGQQLPRLSELVVYLAEVLMDPDDHDASRIYDYLSALTHPTVHVLRSRIEVLPPDSEHHPEITPMRLSMPDTSEPRDLTFLALRYFVEMWRLAATYYGLDRDDPLITDVRSRLLALRTATGGYVT